MTGSILCGRKLAAWTAVPGVYLVRKQSNVFVVELSDDFRTCTHSSNNNRYKQSDVRSCFKSRVQSRPPRASFCYYKVTFGEHPYSATEQHVPLSKIIGIYHYYSMYYCRGG